MEAETFNPVTRALVQQLSDPDVGAFARQWDVLEQLVIRVFRGKEATQADEAELQRLKVWLAQTYPRWQDALAAYWPHVKAGGEPVREDPFAWLMGVARARDLVENWAAMQMLPAARETLNLYLVDRIEQAR